MGSVHLATFVLLLFLLKTTVSYPHHSHDISHLPPDNPHIKYTYTRFPEIENHCGSLISSASELPPDDNRGERMKKELSFINGDWIQESSGSVPLMPFDAKGMSNSGFDRYPPLKLVSFWLMDVDPIRRAENTLSVSGAMDIGISTADIFAYKPYNWIPQYQNMQGNAKLTILFEGIYVESNKEEGGQGVMCLLGNATFPNPNSSQEQTSGLQNDQILFVLQYPKTFTLTTRGISGEMQTLNHHSSLAYFDKIQVLAQQGIKYLKYQFGSHDQLLTSACEPYPHPDPLVGEKVDLYKGDEYCEKLRKFVWSEVFEVNGHGQIGPFSSGEVSDRLRFIFQDLECELVTDDQNGEKSALVSAVLRVIQKSGDYIHREEMRTGISSSTLSLEGKWHSSDGQLCMVGCLGPPDGLSERCGSRVTLYFPVTFSIEQRAIVFGSISSIHGFPSHPPLMFLRLLDPQNLWQCGVEKMNFLYRYSMIMQAREFQGRSRPSKLMMSLRKAFLRFPVSKGGHIVHVSSLADELSVKACAESQICVEIVILSIGSLVGRYGPESYEEKIELGKRSTSSWSYEEVKVSGSLSLSGGQFLDVSFLFEGIYDPGTGVMYLVGCKDVAGSNLENGLDCLIEMEVEYPPRNAKWLLNPKIKLSLKSRRNEADPLYIHPVIAKKFLVSLKEKYNKDGILFRKGFEDGLQILSLIAVILCIRSQNRYTKDHVARISLAMLGVQAIGFIIPLIKEGEVLCRWKEFTEYRNRDQMYDFRISHDFHHTPEYIIKILLLCAFLETRRLLKKVVKSRKVERKRTPSDKPVILSFFLIHLLGFAIFHSLRNLHGIPLNTESEKYAFSSPGKGGLEKWQMELETYSGIVQDCFLIPQIIGNGVWGVRGKPPLTKLYYVGLTSIRVLIQAYDYVRDPVTNFLPSDSELGVQYLAVEPYYKFENVVISAIVVLLAVVVHIQQKYGSSWIMKEE